LGDRVLAFVRLQGRARRGGVPIDAPFAHVATFDGTQITYWRAYARREEALQAVGLSGSRRERARPLARGGVGRLAISVAERARRAGRRWSGLARRSSRPR
jgi:hypothetical protein